ncbi:MAG: metallophosphoesterase [Bacteroidetes bacterium]|nr:metallophosphoesterase [Bacteroidota bacterium]
MVRLAIIFCILFTSGVKAINQIRWGSSDGPINGLTITWSNSGTSDSIKWGYSSNLEMGTSVGTIRPGYLDNFFKYSFQNVQANSTIYYKLFDSNLSSWTTEMTYQTAPPQNDTSFSFIAMGDSRTDMTTWNQISNLANSKHGNFAIFTGDIVTNGANNLDWDDWFFNGSQYINNNLVFHCIGNHDLSDSANYQKIFDLPEVNGSELYYSFVYNNAVFICLNSEDPANLNQYNWLLNTLNTNKDKTWKIVFFHRPFYTTGGHIGDMNAYFNTWWKAFDDYGVDIIFNGHDHLYERTKPLNRNINKIAPVPSYGSDPDKGRCQIVCGGAGAPLYTGNATWFIEKYQSKHHLCKININGKILTDTTFSETDSIIDILKIDKNPSSNIIFNKISIFPNPTNDFFTLKYNSLELGEAKITIYDMDGKEVSNKKVIKQNENLELNYNIENISKGVYNVELRIGDKKESVFLIKK